MPFDRKGRFCLVLTLVVIPVNLLSSLRVRGSDAPKSLTLASPLDRQVFQRDAQGVGNAVIAGTLPAGVETIEARAVLANGAPRGKTVDWTVIADTKRARSASPGTFQGTLRLPAGGWYQLEVRARQNEQAVAQAKVDKVGVGDIFVTAGQSNSANFGQVRQTAKDDRVVYFDGKSYLPAQDPIPGGFGSGGTPWPLLGDLLARQNNVPICFRSSTLTYTPVSLWLPRAKQNQYETLVERIRQFGPQGVRAVLWHQGESDALAKTTAQQYRDRLAQVIQSVRKEVGYDLDWFVAQASFHTGATKEQQEPIAAGQRLLWQSKIAFPGPVTDDLLGREYRSDGVHFTEKGLQSHARRWLEAIVRQYGKSYQVRYLPAARICLDGQINEPDWSCAKVENDFTFPWKRAAAPFTEFRALVDDHYLYFAFQTQDSDIVVLDKLRDEEDEVFEDRVEMYFCPDDQMKNYFCMEIDSRGRVFDYRGSYYRKLDPKWNCAGVEAKSASLKQGYAVEGRIPLASLEAMGFPSLRPGAKIRCGLYRAEFSHDRSGRPVEHRETIHNRGRRPVGPPPLEEWMSWVDPKTREPDFHLPASLGLFEIVP